MGRKKRRIRVDLLLKRDGDRCTWCCRRMVDAPIHPKRNCERHMTLEHLVPLDLGGSHDLDNLALACFKCNNYRGNSLVDLCPPWAVRSRV